MWKVLICKRCRERVEGGHIETNDDAWHPNCYRLTVLENKRRQEK